MVICDSPLLGLDSGQVTFFTAREPGDGTGLGLYSAWQIMEQRGSEVDSELG